jgi:hypothetical protein
LKHQPVKSLEVSGLIVIDMATDPAAGSFMITGG